MVDLLGPGDAGAPRTVGWTDANIVAELASPNAADTFFADCVANVPGTGTPINQKWTNRLLQQIRRSIRNAGVTQNNADDDMLWKAMQAAGAGNFLPIAGGTMTGPLEAPAGFSTNIIGVTSATTLLQSTSGCFLEFGGSSSYTVTFPTIMDGTRVRFTGIITNNSSGGVTFNSGATSIYINGQIASSYTMYQWTYFDLWYDGGSWIGFACGPSVYASAAYTTGNRLALFTSSGAWTVPAGVNVIYGKVWGAGGGGGGANSSTAPAAGGGGPGGYTEGVFSVTPGAVITITVGTGGAGGTNAPTSGSAGGSSSIGALCSATGGGGGGGPGGGGGSSGNGSGGALNTSGGSAGISQTYASGSTYGGGFGGPGYGFSNSGPNISGAGIGGQFPGGGGNGSSGNAYGGAGFRGEVRIYY